MAHVGLIVKATRACNLRCDYCHDWAVGPGTRMPFPVLAQMTARVLRDPQHHSVEFMWHGGEPTVLPISFYEKALAVQGRFRRDGQRVRNAIQTNGTLLDEAWADFLRDNEIMVSVSLDGPPAIHDRHRRHVSGRGSFDDALRGIRRLQEHGVPFAVLMVVDEDTLEFGGDRVFDIFLEHGISEYGFVAAKPVNEPAVPAGTVAAYYTSPRRMNEFLARLFDRWLEHGDRTIRIRELEAVRLGVLRQKPRFCTLAGGCFGTYYMVEPNGDVAHCDLFVGDDRYLVGNVLNDDFSVMRESPRMTSLRADNDQQLNRMHGCPDFQVCGGWCPHERYLSVRHDPDHREDCCGLRPLIEHVRERMRLATPV